MQWQRMVQRAPVMENGGWNFLSCHGFNWSHWSYSLFLILFSLLLASSLSADLVKTLPLRPAQPSPELTIVLQKRISFDLLDTPIKQAAQFLAKVTGIQIDLDPDVCFKEDGPPLPPQPEHVHRCGAPPQDFINGVTITLCVDNMALKDALFWIAWSGRIVVALDRDAVWFGRRENASVRWESLHVRDADYDSMRDKIFKQMQKKVSFDFLETHIGCAMSFLAKVSGIMTAVDSNFTVRNGKRIPANLTLRVDNMPFEDALYWMCRLLDFKYTVARGVLFLSPDDLRTDWEKERLRQRDADEKETGWYADMMKRFERKVTFDFAQVPLEQAVMFLSRVSGVTIMLDPAVIADVEPEKGNDAGLGPLVTLNVADIPFANALHEITGKTDTAFEVTHSAVYISTPDKIKNRYLKMHEGIEVAPESEEEDLLDIEDLESDDPNDPLEMDPVPDDNAPDELIDNLEDFEDLLNIEDL